MEPGLKHIPLNGDVTISTTVLVRANEESIRLGFSRNLLGIDGFPVGWVYSIVAAAVHTSTDDLQNIRLIILLPSEIGSVEEAADSLVPHMLDVAPDTWADILRRSRRKQRRKGDWPGT